MPRPELLPRAPRPARPRRRSALTAAALSLLIAAGGCAGSAAGGPTRAAGTGGATPVAAGVTGPLCDLLPSGTDPGNPASLARLPADEALAWITVLTTFEAVVRASGMAADLRDPAGVTILAPTDDAFRATFSEENLDQLLLVRKDELRTLLRSHLVAGSRPLSELVSAGRVTTLAGDPVTVTAQGGMARIAGRADTVCADYQAANARIHVVNQVLGNLPSTAHEGELKAH